MDNRYKLSEFSPLKEVAPEYLRPLLERNLTVGHIWKEGVFDFFMQLRGDKQIKDFSVRKEFGDYESMEKFYSDKITNLLRILDAN